ncbi:MAG: transglutaminase [Betaproteobacteria bacterium]|nr:transglutaminase [Betaproteobacteria bacterium]
MEFTPPGNWPHPGPAYLGSTEFLDWQSDPVMRFVEKTVAGALTDVEKAVRLFYAVRDDWRYDPFSMRLNREHYFAGRIIAAKEAYCIPKAILLAAAARAAGIPAGIGLSDVVNHLTTEKLRQRMGGQTLFMHHGYAVMLLEGRWVKAAPAFNIGLCTRFDVLPTNFDGRSDAIFQPYDARDRRHMEYVKDHGIWSDFPYEKVCADFRAFYPPATFGEDAPDERFEDGVPLR